MGTNYIAPIWRMPRNANKDKLSNYSMDFQTGGSAGRHIGCGTDLFTGSDIPSISISVWIKTSASGVIMSKDITTNLNRNFLFQIAGNQLYWQTSVDGTNFDSLIVSQGTFNVIDSQWHHIVVTYNSGTSSGDGEKKIYIDGSEIADSPLATYGEIYNTSSVPIEIGRRGDNTRYFYDNMSQVCIFDYALDSTQVGYLYGLNNPMVPGAVNLTTPIAYWPLGDNSNPNAPGSFPNISVGADSVFNFSTQDNIESPHIDMTGAMSISGWFKTTDTGYSMIYQEDEAIRSPSGPDRNWFFSTVNNVLRFAQFYDSGGSSVLNTSGVTVNDGNWHHGVFVWDGTTNTDSMKIFVDGILRGKLTAAKTDRSNDDVTGMIGGNSATYDTNGELSNIQIWNTNLTYGTASVLGDVATGEVAELYNNGQPLMTGTQPQEANLKAWYKLNQTANYDQGIGPFKIDIVGTGTNAPDYGSGNGCFTTGGVLRWTDTNSELLNTGKYFTYYSPLIFCNSNDVDLITTGGSYASASSQLEYALEYSVDGGSWTTWKTDIVPSGTTTTAWTVGNVNNLNCSKSIQVRLRATGGLFGTSNFDFNDVRVNVSGIQTYFETFATAGLGWTNSSYTAPTDNYLDPSWQIPNAVSAYPQSFNFLSPTSVNSPGYYNFTDDFTISVWAKAHNVSSTYGMIFAIGSPGFSPPAGPGAYFGFAKSNRKLLYDDSSSGAYFSSNNVWEYDEWCHIVLVKDASITPGSNNLQMYINGQPDSIAYESTEGVQGQLTLGRWLGSTAFRLDGNISNFQFWDTALSAPQVLTLYNDGTPLTSAIETANLQGWWKLDNTATWDGTEWDFPDLSGNAQTLRSNAMTERSLANDNVAVSNGESVNMNSTNLVQSNLTRTQPYSNYSFNFDGATNDYINSTDNNIFSFGDSVNDSPFSMSAWVKTTSTAGKGIISKWGNTGTSGYEWLLWMVTNKVRLNLLDGTNTVYQTAQGNTDINTGEWVHIITTYDGRGGDGTTNSNTANQGIKIYVNGIEDTPYSYLNNGAYVAMHNTARVVQLGAYNNVGQFDGQISNVAIFNKVLDESEILNIYNNGITQDLQALYTFSGNIVAWWPMDQRSSYFDGTNWVVRELENGQDGTGVNTNNVEDMIGDAPGSDANGTGSNLAIADLKGNMYNSDKNAFSINMADYADGVTNPANSGRSTDTP